MSDGKEKSKYVYKGYNPKNSKYSQKYNREHYRNAMTSFQKEFFDSTLKPVCDRLGMSVSAFVKEAILEKIERENLKEEGSRD